jgi:aryl-alcohol dehydrogenase-like predicted oxidoreductase
MSDAIAYTRLGRTGLKVSRLCLGTMNFGPQTSEAESFGIMDRALELGINFFDTADVYGWKTGEGVTEQILGRWFAQGGGRREKVVLATKVYGTMGDWPDESKLSALHIRRACEGSLRRLKTDFIDLYQMHHVDRDTPLGGDLAGHGAAPAGGESRLRGEQQFRRLAHRPGLRGGKGPRHHGASVRAEPVPECTQ